ncbi:hypothetical protein BDA99DRAFT_543557 [Phascolomyces articulosus]|uniref:Uncharacterized protein n=1 Tax=Phascolomyces articulosus TaxID=60185 RepID=A0AAD5P7U7_9FUNG|nr:hypothetical protein BDA99DRAFT_543557 [Phascolomyces articulosus]
MIKVKSRGWRATQKAKYANFTFSIYEALTVDTLHQLGGVYSYLVICTKKMLKKEKKEDKTQDKIKETTDRSPYDENVLFYLTSPLNTAPGRTYLFETDQKKHKVLEKTLLGYREKYVDVTETSCNKNIAALEPCRFYFGPFIDSMGLKYKRKKKDKMNECS